MKKIADICAMIRDITIDVTVTGWSLFLLFQLLFKGNDWAELLMGTGYAFIESVF